MKDAGRARRDATHPLEEYPAIRQACARTAELARDAGLDCVLGAVAGEELVILAEAGDRSSRSQRPSVGQRLPNAPAISVLSAAYADSDGLEAWLDRLGPGASEAAREGFREAAALVRSRGFEIGIESPTRKRIGHVLAELAADPEAPALHATLDELVAQLALEGPQLFEPKPRIAYRVNHISAPIFDRQVRCIGGLTLLGFEKGLHAPEIEQYIRVVVEAAEDITRTTGGRTPRG